MNTNETISKQSPETKAILRKARIVTNIGATIIGGVLCLLGYLMVQ